MIAKKKRNSIKNGNFKIHYDRDYLTDLRNQEYVRNLPKSSDYLSILVDQGRTEIQLIFGGTCDVDVSAATFYLSEQFIRTWDTSIMTRSSVKKDFIFS